MDSKSSAPLHGERRELHRTECSACRTSSGGHCTTETQLHELRPEPPLRLPHRCAMGGSGCTASGRRLAGDAAPRAAAYARVAMHCTTARGARPGKSQAAVCRAARFGYRWRHSGLAQPDRKTLKRCIIQVGLGHGHIHHHMKRFDPSPYEALRQSGAAAFVWRSRIGLAPLWSGAAALAASRDQALAAFNLHHRDKGGDSAQGWHCLLFRHPSSIATGPACCSPVRQCGSFALCNDRKIRKSNYFSATSLFRRIPPPMTIRR